MQNLIQDPKHYGVHPGLQATENIQLSQVFALDPGTYTVAVTRSFWTPEGRAHVTSATAAITVQEHPN